ncbi:hypothetical protein M885DRAFT_624617 [Pelagophyceae sp. CCMP2097]|nr:hypothetical protein M885DRAFT_624617 [Pelagophyceae sp. CCMP2097]
MSAATKEWWNHGHSDALPIEAVYKSWRENNPSSAGLAESDLIARFSDVQHVDPAARAHQDAFVYLDRIVGTQLRWFQTTFSRQFLKKFAAAVGFNKVNQNTLLANQKIVDISNIAPEFFQALFLSKLPPAVAVGKGYVFIVLSDVIEFLVGMPVFFFHEAKDRAGLVCPIALITAGRQRRAPPVVDPSLFLPLPPLAFPGPGAQIDLARLGLQVGDVDVGEMEEEIDQSLAHRALLLSRATDGNFLEVLVTNPHHTEQTLVGSSLYVIHGVKILGTRGWVHKDALNFEYATLPKLSYNVKNQSLAFRFRPRIFDGTSNKELL